MSFGGPVSRLHSVNPLTRSLLVQEAPVQTAQLAPWATTPRAMVFCSDAISVRSQPVTPSSQ